MNITDYLNTKGFSYFEGYSQEIPEQAADLIALTRKSNMTAMEIGFNAGHSAEIFLKNNTTLSLTSFDLGEHDYVLTAKDYIDSAYTERHTLILGDSRQTVPRYSINNHGKTFDLIFIDGGHDYTVAEADLKNCMKLAHHSTIVVLDDIYMSGPALTWSEHISAGVIIEIGRSIYSCGRGMAWGRYVH